MPAPTFQPRAAGLDSTIQSALLDRIIERVQRDLPDAIGLAVTVHDRSHGDQHAVVAALGLGRDFAEAQLAGPGGPVTDASEYQVPVISPDLWSDDRWPELTSNPVFRQAHGAAAVPGVWQADETVVLSCVLDRPATAATAITLIGYEQLITAAMVTAAAQDSAQTADMLAVLQSRGSIEQAKGVIMGMLRTDADTAWSTLRRASHESNVKLRVLAVALLEHVGGGPAEQPAVEAPIVPDEAARRAAQLLWAVLSHSAAAAAAD